MENTYGETIGIFKSRIPMSVRAAETSAEGKSTYIHDPRGKVAKSYVKTQIQLLTGLLEKKYDVISGYIPEDIVETFIEQIVVHDDYFEWRLRTSTEPVLCKVEGNAKDNTIIFLENDSHKVATQYRQLSLTSNALISEKNIIT